MLVNPINDARAVAGAFERLGFETVLLKLDLPRNEMLDALKVFADKAAQADAAIVYYAGHGIEVNGINYLIPIGAKLARDTAVALEAIPLDAVLDATGAARKLRIVILDACRDNPFAARMVRSAGRTRSVSSGLTSIEPTGGVLVAYAARHGTVAFDGQEGQANSPFTSALIAELETPRTDVSLLFRRVRDRVLAGTGGRQEPFTYGSLPGELIYLKP